MPDSKPPSRCHTAVSTRPRTRRTRRDGSPGRASAPRGATRRAPPVLGQPRNLAARASSSRRATAARSRPSYRCPSPRSGSNSAPRPRTPRRAAGRDGAPASRRSSAPGAELPARPLLSATRLAPERSGFQLARRQSMSREAVCKGSSGQAARRAICSTTPGVPRHRRSTRCSQQTRPCRWCQHQTTTTPGAAKAGRRWQRSSAG
mmetsp:Transcript_67167/g.169561  ORF Transcript_67167/g.169561 Transcript_67167/m.169561 type:complete len:205 (-) Transcript_67167:83-697(-)